MSEGHPVTIITVDEDEKLTLDVAALESVLNQAELRDRPVCLLPIAGTFFLSQFLFWYLLPGLFACCPLLVHFGFFTICLLIFCFSGAFRKGKSFLLNVLLHHLQAEGKGEVCYAVSTFTITKTVSNNINDFLTNRTGWRGAPRGSQHLEAVKVWLRVFCSGRNLSLSCSMAKLLQYFSWTHRYNIPKCTDRYR